MSYVYKEYERIEKMAKRAMPTAKMKLLLG